MPPPFLLAVMGPTASGKSALAEQVARRTGAQLLNADAFQVYTGLDIGTGKPRDRAAYRLLDIVRPDEDFGLGMWIQLVRNQLESLWEEGRPVILVGGTGLYIRALMEEYQGMVGKPDPALRRRLVLEEEKLGQEALRERLQRIAPDVTAKVDLANPVRVRRALEKVLDPARPIRLNLPGFARYKVALNPPLQTLNESIGDRLATMLSEGWTDEVSSLLAAGYTASDPAFRAIGYRQIVEVIQGVKGLEEAKEEILIATRQYAKRQRTWLRGEPTLHFLSHRPYQAQSEEIESIINS